MKLNKSGRKAFAKAIATFLHGDMEGLRSHFKAVRKARFADKTACPRCGSENIKRNGAVASRDSRRPVRHRYLCKDCRRTFNDLTSSPMAGTHYPEKWTRHIQCMLEGLTLKQTAERLDISITTAFHWRHKVLAALRDLPADRPLTGIVEADETYFLESQKGDTNRICRARRKRGDRAKLRGVSRRQIAVLVAVDRTGGVVSCAIGRGRPKGTDIAAVLHPTVRRDAALVSDGAHSFRHFSKAVELEHHVVLPGERSAGKTWLYHLQHVNSHHSRLKKWMRRFNGVADKYLNHYLAWFRLLEQTKTLAGRSRRAALLTTACRVWRQTKVRDFPFPEAPWQHFA